MNHTPSSQELREQVLALFWILLFTSHWIGLTLVNWLGLARREQIIEWNEIYFSKIYLLLLTLTLLHTALRIVRQDKRLSPLPPIGDEPHDRPAQRGN